MGMMCQVMAAKITAKAGLWGSMVKSKMDVLIGQITKQKKSHENGEGVGRHDKVKNNQQRHENNRGIQGWNQGEDRMVGFIVVFAVRKIGPAIHAPKFRRRMKQKTVGDILEQRPNEQGDATDDGCLP